MSNEATEHKVENKILHYLMLGMATIAAFFAAKAYERMDNIEKMAIETIRTVSTHEVLLSELKRNFESHEQQDEKIFEKTQMQLGVKR